MPNKRNKRPQVPMAATNRRTPSPCIADEYRRLKSRLADQRNPPSRREADKATRRIQAIEAAYHRI